MSRQLAAVLVLLSLAISALAVSNGTPKCLVVQRLSTDEDTMNIIVGQYLAEELDVEGRVTPILWSMTDVVFRQAIADDVLPVFVENPDDKTIRDYARRLRVDYVLVVEAAAFKGAVYPQAKLYRGSSSRTIWAMFKEENRGRPRLVVTENGKVNQEQTAKIREQYASVLGSSNVNTFIVMAGGEPDWDSTARSLARTWKSLLGGGPFKNLEPQRRQFAPDPEPGIGFSGFAGSEIETAPEVQEALEKARLLAANGLPDQAIILLRDSIDANPFVASTRLLLSQLLILRGHPTLAAEEAERAARITGGSAQLWAQAAEAWLQAGDTDKAHLAANESLARGNSDLGLTLTLADIRLLKRDTAASIKSYDEVIASQPSSRAYIGRSVARAIVGDVQGSVDDLEVAQGGASLPQELYLRAMLIVEQEIGRIADELRAIPKAVRMKSDPNVVSRAEAVKAETQAIVEFMVRVRVPSQHKISHEQRDLAHKLLAQSAYEALAFAKTANEDSAMESAISLGEALRLLPQIRAQFGVERKYGHGA